MNNSRSKTQANLDQKKDINEHGETPLHRAAENGRISIVRNLIDMRYSVNSTDKDKRTPLHLAAKNGHKEVVEVLLINNAINTQDNRGLSPLHLAAIYNHTEVAEALLRYKANVNPHKLRLDSIVHIKYEANVNAQDNHGLSPLHYASQNGHTEVAEALLRYKADVNAKTKNGSGPLHLAARNNRPELAKILLEKGADINAENNRKKTPLQEASERGYSETANALKNPYYHDIESKINHARDVTNLPPRLERLAKSLRMEKKGLNP